MVALNKSKQMIRKSIKSKLKENPELINDIENLFKEGQSITQIGKTFGIWYHTIGKIIRSKGYTYSYVNKKKIDSTIFSIIDTEEKAYWLGFLYADGCVKDSNGIELALQAQDVDHLDKFKKFLKWEGKIYFNKKSNSYRIMFQDAIIAQSLIDLGCFPRKSLTLKFPTEEQVPNNLIRHFIRGYFDGDGSISLNYSKTTDLYSGGCAIMGTLEFLVRLKEKLIENGIYANYKIRTTLSKAMSIDIYTSRNKSQFIHFLYKDCNIYLDRKYDKYKKFCHETR